MDVIVDISDVDGRSYIGDAGERAEGMYSCTADCTKDTTTIVGGKNTLLLEPENVSKVLFPTWEVAATGD